MHTCGPESESRAADPRPFTAPSVPDCVGQALAVMMPHSPVSTAPTEGEEALLVLLPDAANDTRVTAYIVEATCMSNSSSTAAHVLLTQFYRRRRPAPGLTLCGIPYGWVVLPTGLQACAQARAGMPAP